MQRSLLSLFLLGSFVLSVNSDAQDKAAPGGLSQLLSTRTCQGKDRLLDISAERLTFDSETRTFTFEEKVRVHRCDITLFSDRLQVTNDIKGGSVERLIAQGHVRLQQGVHRVRAERAEYFDAEQKLVLTGNPRAWNTQELHEVSGEEIVVFLVQEKIAVKRARVVFHPQQQPTPAAIGR
jgi:lipopolysaccharide export system protein LptA